MTAAFSPQVEMQIFDVKQMSERRREGEMKHVYMMGINTRITLNG